jgi:ketosteroid isomerase-like protein
MYRLIVAGFFGWIAVFAGVCAVAQEANAPAGAKAEADANDPRHDELRALRDAVVKAVNDRDIDALLKHLHPNVVVVWQNAEISRKHQGVRDYYLKTLGGPNAVLESYTVDPHVDELTIFYGADTGISYGTATSHFKFKDGETFALHGPWSATLVKEDGRWQIVEFHASAGLFDNPLVAAAKKALYWGCGLAGAAGLAVGMLGMAIFRRKKTA